MFIPIQSVRKRAEDQPQLGLASHSPEGSEQVGSQGKPVPAQGGTTGKKRVSEKEGTTKAFARHSISATRT